MARDPTNENHILALNAELSGRNPIVTTKWLHRKFKRNTYPVRILTQQQVADGDAKAPARFFAIFDPKEPNLRQAWTRAKSLISEWASVTEKE